MPLITKKLSDTLKSLVDMEWRHMDYQKEIPRDLFNNAKLLSGIGRLCLLIHDGMGLGINVQHYYPQSFNIALCNDNMLHITNLKLDKNRHQLFFRSQYNSKSKYTIFCEFDNMEYEVFDEHVDFTIEFSEFINTL